MGTPAELSETDRGETIELACEIYDGVANDGRDPSATIKAIVIAENPTAPIAEVYKLADGKLLQLAQLLIEQNDTIGILRERIAALEELPF